MTYVDVHGEIYYDGGWNALPDVREFATLAIERGARQEGASLPSPGKCGFDLPNNDGTYAPRNVTGSLYGKIGRDTPVRFWEGVRAVGAVTQTIDAATSHVAPSVTAETAHGLVIGIWSTRVSVLGNYTLPGGFTAGPTETDSSVSTVRTGYRALSASGATGTATATYSGTVTSWAAAQVVIHGDGADPVVEETLSTDVANTTATVTLDAGTEAGWWLVAIGTWSRDDSDEFSQAGLKGPFVHELVNSGANGVSVRTGVWVRPIVEAGAQDVVFPVGSVGGGPNVHLHVYVLSGVAPWSYRFAGEVPVWPRRSQTGEFDVVVRAQAYGPLKRLTTKYARTPLRAALHDEIINDHAGPSSVMTGFWPGDDGDNTSVVASGLADHPPLTLIGSEENRAAIAWRAEKIFPGAAETLQLSGGVSLYGAVPDHTATGIISVRMALDTTVTPVPDGAALIGVIQSDGGSIAQWNLEHDTGGLLRVRGYNSAGVVVHGSASVAFSINDDGKMLLGFSVEQSGADVVWRILQRRVSTDTLTTFETGFNDTFTTATVGKATAIWIGQTADLEIPLGYVMIGTSLELAAGINEALRGYSGETAAARIRRLLGVLDIACVIRGDRDKSVVVGPQRIASPVDNINDAVFADGGELFEPRDQVAIGYRVLSDMTGQATALPLTYAQVAGGLSQAPDGPEVRNDIEIKREGGSSVRRTEPDGPWGTEEIGRQPYSDTRNVALDTQLPDQASWELVKGTIDRDRFEGVTIHLVRAIGLQTPDPVLRLAASWTDIGDRLVVGSLPADFGPDDALQLVRGYTERCAGFDWQITFQGTPADPYDAAGAEYDATTARYDSADTYLLHALTTSATTVRIKNTGEEQTPTLWSTTASGYLWRCGAEDILVDSAPVTTTGSLVGFSTAHADNASLTPTIHGSATIGDAMVLYAASRNTSGIVGLPSGWNVLFADGHIAAFGRIHTGAESNPTVTFTGGSAGDTTSAILAVFRGAQVDEVFALANTSNGSQQNVNFPTFTPLRNKLLNLWFGWKQDDWTSAGNLYSGIVEVTEASTAIGNDQALVMNYEFQNDRTAREGAFWTITGGAVAVGKGYTLGLRTDIQSVTVIRARNGVTQAHSAGDQIRLRYPARYGRA